MPEREMPLAQAEGWLDYWETVGLSSDPAALDERAAARAIRAELARLRAIEGRARALSVLLRMAMRERGSWRKHIARALAASSTDRLRYRKLLDQVGDAVGVRVGNPSPARYDEFADKIKARALRLRAERLDARTALAAPDATPTETSEH